MKTSTFLNLFFAAAISSVLLMSCDNTRQNETTPDNNNDYENIKGNNGTDGNSNEDNTGRTDTTRQDTSRNSK